jgi:hypothetical protein
VWQGKWPWGVVSTLLIAFGRSYCMERRNGSSRRLNFLLSHTIIGKFKTRRSNLDYQLSTRPQLPYTFTLPTYMSTLLCIASRVEAAVAAYNSVRGFTNPEEWKVQLKREFVSLNLHGV